MMFHRSDLNISVLGCYPERASGGDAEKCVTETSKDSKGVSLGLRLFN
jgi:hypothetical protein